MIASLVFLSLISSIVLPTYVFAQTTQQSIEASKQQAIARFQEQFCGLNSKPNSNKFISEYSLPGKCKLPLGILVGDNAVWYISTKDGILGRFDTNVKNFTEFTIPEWRSRLSPVDISQTWDIKSDSNGRIWFTDEKQNGLWSFDPKSKQFAFYKVPESSKDFGTTYPVSIAFDKNQNIYFVGIRSPAIWFANTSLIKPSTSEGISKINLSLSGFKGIPPDLVSTGSIAVDNDRHVIWVSLLAFANKGQLLKYDINSRNITAFDLPNYLNSPVGIVLDNTGNPWVTDHGTSKFFRFNATDNKITEYSTSPNSVISNGAVVNNAYSLPYWVKIAPDGMLWFNEHIGNKLARFDPNTSSLVEFKIPSHNMLWGGIANALQFAIGRNNDVWFTEWTENKIAMLNSTEPLPFTADVSEDEVDLKKGDVKAIKVSLKANEDVDLKLVGSSTITSTGSFGNSTTSFSQDAVNMKPGETKEITFLFTPAQDLKAGDYTIMLGAENDEVSYLKAVKVHIT
jgi:virginiamycin B lyase